VQYDVHKDPHKNIALPDSLLSRFDLLFVVTDDVDERRDRMHRYLQPGVVEGTPAQDNLTQPLAIDNPAAEVSTLPTDTSPFEKFDPLLHGGVTTTSGRASGKKKEVLSMAFVKKYIRYAKARDPPVLTKGAADYIVNAYATFRNEDEDGKKRVRRRDLLAICIDTTIDIASDGAYARDAHPSIDSPCKSAAVTACRRAGRHCR